MLNIYYKILPKQIISASYDIEQIIQEHEKKQDKLYQEVCTLGSDIKQLIPHQNNLKIN